MLLSFYAHVSFVVSIVVFVFSLLSFLWRFRNDCSPHEVCQHWWFNNQPIPTMPTVSVVHQENIQQNEDVRRRQVLGADQEFVSLFDRFTFVNPYNMMRFDTNTMERTVLIIVLSRAINFNFRQTIRATWGRNAKYKSSSIDVRTLFFVGLDDSVRLAIRNEQALFRDVIEIGNAPNRCTVRLCKSSVFLCQEFQSDIHLLHTKNWPVYSGQDFTHPQCECYFEPMTIFSWILFSYYISSRRA
jgi:hypothetical protein